MNLMPKQTNDLIIAILNTFLWGLHCQEQTFQEVATLFGEFDSLIKFR